MIMQKLTIQQIKKVFPNAHPEWVLVTKKQNGTKNFKTKKEKESKGRQTVDLWPMVQAVQTTQKVC